MSRIHPETHVLPQTSGPARAQHRVQKPLSAIVVGGGIAGIAAATVLSERGVHVTLIEREPALGGRAGGFSETLPSGERVQMERGFHGFFRQYYTLRALLRRIDPKLSMLTELPDYPVLGPDGMVQSFSNLPKRTPLQVMALTLRTPYLRARDLARVNGREALEMLAYDPERTYARYDSISAEQYLASLKMPDRARRMLFDVFAHSFFNPEASMSAAELLMMFHFYFTGNPEGLVFDVANEPLGVALWQPFARYLQGHGVTLKLGTSVQRVRREVQAGATRYAVEHEGGEVCADLLVLALDVAGLRSVVQHSPDLAPLAPSIEPLAVTHPFAVLRLWLDRPMHEERVAFAGTTGVGLLDNISVYDRFQGESARWARAHHGSVVELHAYAVPHGLSNQAVRADLIAGLHTFYPEARAAKILHERFLMRDDCPAFEPSSHAQRPHVSTVIQGVVLAGDGIRTPMPCALMERAAITGFLAANTLLAPYGIAAEPITSVPSQGLLAPTRRRASRTSTNGKSEKTLRLFGRRLAPAPVLDTRPDWQQASAAWIKRALAHSQSLPTGGWFAVDASSAIGSRPRGYRVNGVELVVFRDDRGIIAAPEACPHLGASLQDAKCEQGKLVCPWHGLALGREGHAGWRPFKVHDDGVLFWVQLQRSAELTMDKLTSAPFLPERPKRALDAVIRVEAACEPRDVIANRLDPWHGAHYHPHSFGSLRVIDQEQSAITVRVAYKVLEGLAVEVDARFHCSDRRTIVMTIIGGEGTGSVVETHATPIGPGRTAIVEATLATSERPGFGLAIAAAPALRPIMSWAARRLWTEDAAYAERLYSLRDPVIETGCAAGSPHHSSPQTPSLGNAPRRAISTSRS